MKVINYDRNGNLIDLSTVTITREEFPGVWDAVARMMRKRGDKV